MKRSMLFGLLLVGAVAWLAVGRGVEDTRSAMRLKLDYARGVLEGVTLAKFDLVATNAQLLGAVNYTNAFTLVRHADYGRHATNFAQSVERLLDAAKAQNVDQATLAYVEMTRGCVACHKSFRRAQLFTPSPAPAR